MNLPADLDLVTNADWVSTKERQNKTSTQINQEDKTMQTVHLQGNHKKDFQAKSPAHTLVALQRDVCCRDEPVLEPPSVRSPSFPGEKSPARTGSQLSHWRPGPTQC